MFITLEGLDGSGKTTQAKRLSAALQAAGHRVYLTREPGGTAIGDQIRAILHRLDNQAMHPHTEVLLYQASRAQLVAQEIRPRLAQGEIVVCDRFFDSTLAYQGYGHGLDLVTLHRLIDFATDGLLPDLTLYFAITPEVGLRRRQQDGEWNRMDEHMARHYATIQNGYQALIAQDTSGRWRVIPAESDPDSVFAEVWRVVEAALGARNR